MRKYHFPDPGSFEFVASVSQVNRAQFVRMVDALEDHGLVKEAFSRLMYCPLTSGGETIAVLEDLHNQYDIHISCDSGGYESQINEEYSMRDIFQFDREYYLNTDWPDEYVLPDQVPIAGDDEQTVEHKVQDTISLSRMLYDRLPEEKQRKAVPVVQGQTKRQIVDCLDAYTEFDHITKIGFGSFSTGGVNGGVNYLTEENIELLQFVVKEARKHDLDVHAFGVGGPTSIPILYRCGVQSFDSTGWMRSAGYGNVFFSFKSRFNITHRRNRSGPTVFKQEFTDMKEETGHECPYCASFDKLQESRLYRILHNLIVIREMTEQVEAYSTAEILELMSPQSKYRTYLERMAAT
jgi:tRNA-guanine family transglycosylase